MGEAPFTALRGAEAVLCLNLRAVSEGRIKNWEVVRMKKYILFVLKKYILKRFQLLKKKICTFLSLHIRILTLLIGIIKTI